MGLPPRLAPVRKATGMPLPRSSVVNLIQTADRQSLEYLESMCQPCLRLTLRTGKADGKARAVREMLIGLRRERQPEVVPPDRMRMVQATTRRSGSGRRNHGGGRARAEAQVENLIRHLVPTTRSLWSGRCLGSRKGSSRCFNRSAMTLARSMLICGAIRRMSRGRGP